MQERNPECKKGTLNAKKGTLYARKKPWMQENKLRTIVSEVSSFVGNPVS